MSPGATAEEIDAVVHTVQAAGGSAFVSRGVHRTIIGLVGDVEQFESLNLRAYGGVSEVVRISTPYKLVSRDNHPATSTVNVAGVDIGPDTFTLIAGPCAVETAGGRKNRTVRPPSRPCAITAPSAATPSQRTQRRDSAIHNHTASTIVRKPTVLAISRWPCSYRMPPTQCSGGNVNMFQPYVVGQSGTERPDAVLVTRLPARTSRIVQPATNVAKRCSKFS